MLVSEYTQSKTKIKNHAGNEPQPEKSKILLNEDLNGTSGAYEGYGGFQQFQNGLTRMCLRWRSEKEATIYMYNRLTNT